MPQGSRKIQARRGRVLAIAGVVSLLFSGGSSGDDHFEGRRVRGRGDREHLELLETALGLFEANPRLQNLSMLYLPAWNGLVEGPTWDAWWIQNSYGTTYCALPFLEEPFLTFLQNSQDLWFDQMGDGKRAGFNGWVAPDGCLCDAARPGWIVYKQGDGRTDIHDWGMEFTAAGVVLQAELLLEGRDQSAIARYLPRLERCVAFVESRRDPSNDLFLAGPAGNLLAPSFAGWRRPDGTYGMAYLAGLSVTHIAALDRMAELERLAGRPVEADRLSTLRERARKGLERLSTSEGYLVKSLDPDGVLHGVFGAPRHGYFEASPNHDAIAFRVVDDERAARIWAKMASIPELRPFDFVLPNFPSLDDMYEKPEGLWSYGTWVNGGHWSTCEARMVLAYHRLGKFEDARRSLRRLLGFARRFRMDNPLTGRGSEVYQPGEPINLCYDSLGPAAAFVRGLFEGIYRHDRLTLVPHIPPGITDLDLLVPIRFGTKRIYLRAVGEGLIAAVDLNGSPWPAGLFTPDRVELPFDRMPDRARVVIHLGSRREAPEAPAALSPGDEPLDPSRLAGMAGLEALAAPARRLAAFRAALEARGMGTRYEAAHARLALEAIKAAADRRSLLAKGKLEPLPSPTREAADKSYLDTAVKLHEGLEKALRAAAGRGDPGARAILAAWESAGR